MTLIKIAPSRTASGATSEGSAPQDALQRALAQERALRIAEAQAHNSQRTEIQGTDISRVPWPEVEHFGWEHHNFTSQLVGYMLAAEKPRDLTIAKTAALYHDLGRARPWQYVEYCAELSARLADTVMRAHPETASYRDDVCRLIALHGTTPEGPLAIALHDADLLEAARFAPGTPSGLQAMKLAYARLLTPWARDVETQRRWREKRGWR